MSNRLKEQLDNDPITSYEHVKFKTIAEGRNAVEGTSEYTSDMRNPDKIYMGRGTGSGFVFEGVFNQFIDFSKKDGKWINKFENGNMFLESWKDTSLREAIDEWKIAKKDMIIRLFVKQDGVYVGAGVYYYAGSSLNGILWKKHTR